MVGRSIAMDHSTMHHWVLHFSPILAWVLQSAKAQVTRKWNPDETYVKVKSEWPCLYRAIDHNGDTIHARLQV